MPIDTDARSLDAALVSPAFVIDPDGNNIEAVWYDYSKVK